ncbi:hypothetical protein BG004_007528 [Podila humilis]|nr:hypothetical protein BG004_007528 [Podila humilis]
MADSSSSPPPPPTTVTKQPEPPTLSVQGNSHSNTDAISQLTDAFDNLNVVPPPSSSISTKTDKNHTLITDTTPVVSSTPAPVATTTTTSNDTSVSTSTLTPQQKSPKVDEQEELSPEEAKLRKLGLKSTHRPGFYVHIDKPKRLRIQTKTHTFDLDRYCPHANADMLKWGVLRGDNTLRCGVHYWGFSLQKDGQCIAHPEETLNACVVSDLEW